MDIKQMEREAQELQKYLDDPPFLEKFKDGLELERYHKGLVNSLFEKKLKAQDEAKKVIYPMVLDHGQGELEIIINEIRKRISESKEPNFISELKSWIVRLQGISTGENGRNWGTLMQQARRYLNG